MLGIVRFWRAQRLASWAMGVALLSVRCGEGHAGNCANDSSSGYIVITALGEDAGVCSLLDVTFDYYPAGGCPERGLHDLDFAGPGLTPGCAETVSAWAAFLGTSGM
jgi:hypothetical protein